MRAAEERRNLKTFCYRIGQIETKMLEATFYNMCLKSRERIQKKLPATHEKLNLRDCKFCPMGKAIEAGKKVKPRNVNFIKV